MIVIACLLSAAFFVWFGIRDWRDTREWAGPSFGLAVLSLLPLMSQQFR